MNEFRRLAMLAVVCAVVLSPVTSAAKSTKTTYHTLERVWPTIIRFLRIDMGYDIIDKDLDAGFVLFEFDEDKRRFRGSLELIRTTDSSGRDELRMVMQLYDRPTWMENMIMGKLDRKIYDEHGEAPRPKPKKPKKPDDEAKDGDDGKAKDGNKKKS